MTDTRSVPDLIYPETDGQPMTESDITRDYLTYCVEVLRLYFQSRRSVYVSGNLFIYYQEGNPQAVISPDVFVIFGVSNRRRRSYKIWQEGGHLPSFVMEITSRSTRRQDEVEKPNLYASLGIAEYFQYDPTADYLNPQLKGFRLVDRTYQPLPLQQSTDDQLFIHSTVLGLDLQLQLPTQPQPGIMPLARELRFYDPQTGLKLLNREEVERERDLIQQERDLMQQKAERLAAKLRELGIKPEEIE